MNQSTIIFGYIAVAFLIFITQRGELPVYWGFLVSSPKQPAAGPTATADGRLASAASDRQARNDRYSENVLSVGAAAAKAYIGVPF